MNALVPLPVVLPLCVTGLKLAIGPRLHQFQRFISIAVLGAMLVLSVVLMVSADRHG
ncbi:Na+/H+ antiporter subunit D, partial [Streptomyces violaceoruber]